MAALLAFWLHAPRRFVLVLFFGSLTAGLVVADRAADERLLNRELVRDLPVDRFVTIRAFIDEEWKPSRDGKFSRVDRFEVVLDDATEAIDESLSVYAPADSPPVGPNDFVEMEGFLRESKRGFLYVSVKSRHLITLSARRSVGHPRSWNRRLRTSLERHVAVFPEHERAASLIRAVALGDGSALSSAMRDSYRRGGTYHLLVFSGMQIAFAAAMIALVLRALRLRFATDLSLVTLALLAPAFAGNEPSVSRASTMIGVYGVSRLLGRPTPMSNLLFLSAAIRLLSRPEEVSSPGFLLSYAATFGLVIVGGTLAATVDHPVAKTVAYGIGAELCTQPLTLFFFRHFVAGGFIVTMLLSPLLGVILLLSIPIAVTLAIGSDLAWPLIEIVSRLDELAILINETWSSMSLSGFAPGPPAALVLGSFALAWGAASSRIGSAVSRAIAVSSALLLVPFAVWILDAQAQKEGPYLEFLDIGQGDAILIRTSRTILVDGGGSPSDPDFGRRTLIPLLADRGIRSLDVVVMTHPDVDHCGGLLSTVSSIPVAELWLSPHHLGAPCTTELLSRLSPESRLRFVRDAQTITVGEAELQVTLPRLRFKNNPLNNGSVVMTAGILGTRTLLAGDIEREAETLIADEAAERLAADVLKVAHHGSRTSTTPRFLEVVRPRAAVISSGADNLYGHPAEEVVRRLRTFPAQVLRTDLFGSIRIDLGDGCPTIRYSGDSSAVTLTAPGQCF